MIQPFKKAFALFGFAALICGCGPSAAEHAAATRTSAREGSGESDALTQQENRVQPTWTLSEHQVPHRDDPAADGWQSEAFSRAASHQLQRLGEFIVASSPKKTAGIAKLLDDEFFSDPLMPSELQIEHDSPMFRVQRMSSRSGAAIRKNDGERQGTNSLDRLIAAIHPLQDAMGQHRPLRFKFKLFRTNLDGKQVTTTQYFSLNGRNATGAREQNATWEIVWTLPSPADPPRIQSIRLVEFEQVSTTIDGGRLLTDCTESALGRTRSYSIALRTSVQYWRDRLENQLGVYIFGHHGLAIGDVNGDDRDDLYLCQTGGLPNHLYVQQEDGTLVDATNVAEVDYLDNTRSALFVDLDNDGDQDLILALTSGLMFMENISTGSQPRFQLRARIPSIRQAFSLSAADYDQDTHLDLYVCVYYGENDVVAELPLPLPYFDATNGGANYLIRNRGNWRFDDVTDAVGLDQDNSRFSLASAWEDYDNDGDVDLMVVNDFGPNQLYQNSGGRFNNVAEEVGLLDGAFGMSATFADFDHNQRMDLYVSNMFSAAGNRVTFQPVFKSDLSREQRARFQYLARGNSLFSNQYTGRFEDVSVSHRVTMGRWSWGSLFADLDNDSWDDLLVTNGYLTGESPDDL